jgi:hypothetical protein
MHHHIWYKQVSGFLVGNPYLRTERHAMKTELNRYLLLAAIQLVALNAVAQPVDTFIQHPTHCAIYLGGPDHAADGTDRTYGEALAAAVSSLGGSAGSALSHIRTACLTRPILSTDPERPKSPTSP